MSRYAGLRDDAPMEGEAVLSRRGRDETGAQAWVVCSSWMCDDASLMEMESESRLTIARTIADDEGTLPIVPRNRPPKGWLGDADYDTTEHRIYPR